MKNIKRNLPFIKFIFRQANRYKRQDLLKKRIPVKPPLMAQLRQHKRALREIDKKKNSLKRRRQVLINQRGNGLWTSMDHLLCQCLLKR